MPTLVRCPKCRTRKKAYTPTDALTTQIRADDQARLNRLQLANSIAAALARSGLSCFVIHDSVLGCLVIEPPEDTAFPA